MFVNYGEGAKAIITANSPRQGKKRRTTTWSFQSPIMVTSRHVQLRQAWRIGSGGWGCVGSEPPEFMDIHEEGPPMGMMEDIGDAQVEADRWNSKGARLT